MKNQNQVNRTGIPIGKTKREIEAYRQFLRRTERLEETTEEEETTIPTDQSSFNEEKNRGKSILTTKKSFWLKIKDRDFLQNDLFIQIVTGVVVGLIVLIIGGFYYFIIRSECKQ
jgi:hypothetical protein